jgi:hypothetical protein
MHKNIFNLTLCAMLYALCFSAEAQETQQNWKIGVTISPQLLARADRVIK